MPLDKQKFFSQEVLFGNARLKDFAVSCKIRGLQNTRVGVRMIVVTCVKINFG